MARLLRGNAVSAMENVALWHERDMSDSSVEQVIFPDSTIVLDYLLDRTSNLVERLVVHADRMQENLDLTHGLIYSGQLLLDSSRYMRIFEKLNRPTTISRTTRQRARDPMSLVTSSR